MDSCFEVYYRDVKDLFKGGKILKALAAIEDLKKSLELGTNDEIKLYRLEAKIFMELAKDVKKNELKFVYWLASLECLCRTREVSVLEDDRFKKTLATALSKILVCSPVKTFERKDMVSIDAKLLDELGSYWNRMDSEKKRNFMRVSILGLRAFVDKLGEASRDALEKALSYAMKQNQWKLWLCPSCSEYFCTSEDSKKHLQEEHGIESQVEFPKTMSQKFASKIEYGIWKPLNALACYEIIEKQLEDAKAFAYHNGWSKEWPLAEDEERSELLKEIQTLLMSLYDLKFLTCSIGEWLLSFALKNLQISATVCVDLGLVETPQILCFLESSQLNEIAVFLRKAKQERGYGIDVLCSLVESFCDCNRVKEQIDVDSDFSFLLLDKQVFTASSKTGQRFDDLGTIQVVTDPNLHFGKATPDKDQVLNWLSEYSVVDDGFKFPRPIREHGIDLWIAVLRLVQFMTRTTETYFAKKVHLLDREGETDLSEMAMLESSFDYRFYLGKPLKAFLAHSLRKMRF